MPAKPTVSRQRLVSINFFPAFFPPRSGGEQRYFHLYSALSEYFDIDLITSTNFGTRYEEIWHTPTLRERRFPKDEHWRQAFQTLENAGATGDLSGLAFALAVNNPDCALRHAVLDLASSADYVVHEFPYSEPIFSGTSHPFEIYNSHNFEIGLVGSTVFGEGSGRCFQKLLHLERNLVARVKLVFATGDADAEKFRLLYGVSPDQLRICRNGYAEKQVEPIQSARRNEGASRLDRPQLLFMGSRHPPNVEAADFLFDLAADLEDCDIIIAGGASQHLRDRPRRENIFLFGDVDDSEKQRLMISADLFLNAVTQGSGTSLKSIEAMAAHLPMVATPEAVRGLGLVPGRHAVVCARSGFAAATRALLGDPVRRSHIIENAAALARAQFGWGRIAHQLATDIRDHQIRSLDTDERPTRQRPLIVALNDYPIGAAQAGGGMRLKRVLGNLDADVILVTFGTRYEVATSEPGLLRIEVQKSAHHRAYEHNINEGQAVSVNDIVAGLYCGSHHILAELMFLLASRCEAVMFEHCYMAPLLDLIRKIGPEIPIVYDAHNVETSIKGALLRDHPRQRPLIQFVKELENKLAAAADLIVTCTQADADHFSAMGKITIIVGNGCEPIKVTTKADGRTPRVGFLGSAHPPNVEASWHVIWKLAPLFSDVLFEFVGGVCDALTGPLPGNIVLHGVVDAARKAEILGSWRVALNPVLVGGGSSLKLPDYMAHGLATLSTPAGARGFAVAEHEVGVVAELAEFPSVLAKMIGNAALCSRQGRRARAHANTYLNWTVLTAPLRDWIAKLAHRAIDGRGANSALSLLIVTYRYTEPPLGGAEEYLIELLRWLRPRFSTIDLAAVDVVGPLNNLFHYGCGFTAGDGSARILGELFDTARLFAPDSIPPDDLLMACRQLERAQMRDAWQLYGRFSNFLRDSGTMLPFVGLYPPERHEGGGISRWTAPEFSFLLPTNSLVFDLAGWTPHLKLLTIFGVRGNEPGQGDRVRLHQQYINADFTCRIALNVDTAFDFILCTADEHTIADDYRPFGVLLRAASISLRFPTHLPEPNLLKPPAYFIKETNCDLGVELDALLRIDRFEDWVGALADIASQRPEEDEALFAATRGPHSDALQAWLAENGSRYDIVLVQGIPFDAIPRSVATLRGLVAQPRIVLLPHFHGEDRFYHWRRYLDAFAFADKTLLFSQHLVDCLPSEGKYAVVPGGGIKIEEQASAALVARFYEVHRSGEPFFLILGRKVASKGYQRAIRAIRQVRAKQLWVDLVMIGPDDDKVPVQGDGVHYMGFQPRDVVLGALSSCLGLITMSESESFGIVICEAWKFHKPVIANHACAAFRDLIVDRENGLLVGSDADLAEALHAVASDAVLRERLGKAGFECAVSTYPWQRVADLVSDILVDGLA